MRFKAIGINGMDDGVTGTIIEAKTEEDAYEELDEGNPIFATWFVFNDTKWDNLKNIIKEVDKE